MAEHNTFKLDPVNAIPYYYTKSSDPIIEVGPTPETPALVEFALTNKNPLNIAVPMMSLASMKQTTLPSSIYHWPMPFCFSLPKYEAGAEEGVTQWRIAKEFWAAVNQLKVGFNVFSASLFLIPPGGRTPRLPDNPGGPGSKRWFAGGSYRVLVPLSVGEGAKFVYGPETTTPQANIAYEVNNLLIHQVINDSAEDLIYVEIDLAPWDKLEELESRILLDPVLKELHITNAAGYPAHTTAFL